MHSSTVGLWRTRGRCEDEEDGAPEGRLTLRGQSLSLIVPEETTFLYPAGGSHSES